MMSSDRRLHPASMLFTIGAQAKALIVPGVLLLFTAARSGDDWDVLLLLLLIPYSLFALLQYYRFTYRYDDDQLVIRSGVFVRNERHIPYSRVQNIDASQNVVQRLLGVLVVRVHTGSGGEPEASFSVLPREAFEEMRTRVGRAPAAGDEAAVVAPPLLALSTREVMLLGFIENYGGLILGAVLGLLWEAGVMDRLSDRIFGADGDNTGPIRDVVRAVAGSGLSIGRWVAIAAAIAAFLLLLRVLSMGFAILKMHGYTLQRVNDDLRVEYGLLTRVHATIPLARIQRVTLRQTPLQRLFGRAAIGVATAGAQAPKQEEGRDDHHAVPAVPIVAGNRAWPLLAELLPEIDLTQLQWQPVHPRTGARIARVTFVLLAILTAPIAWAIGWWFLAWLALLGAWSVVVGVRHAASLGWAETADAVACRGGWLWRQTTVARASRIQVVAWHESPFDRRNGMAGLLIDTVGGGPLTGGMDIRYLARSAADGLYDRLSRQIARTAFKW